jgi:hypothetical protein
MIQRYWIRCLVRRPNVLTNEAPDSAPESKPCMLPCREYRQLDSPLSLSDPASSLYRALRTREGLHEASVRDGSKTIYEDHGVLYIVYIFVGDRWGHLLVSTSQTIANIQQDMEFSHIATISGTADRCRGSEPYKLPPGWASPHLQARIKITLPVVTCPMQRRSRCQGDHKQPNQ